ncbi:MAG: ribonuclease P protein component [Vampirovibrionales bacterium]|nr:ribonuclease P protein component [Vampirovibrionales bacterium]
MLPKAARLKARHLFAKALNPQIGYHLGSSPFFKILAVPHGQAYLESREVSGQDSLPLPRFGFIVSKKVDKRAVIRNRLKRRYREIIRNQVLPGLSRTRLSLGLRQYRAIVVIVRQASVRADFALLAEHLLKRLQ